MVGLHLMLTPPGDLPADVQTARLALLDAISADPSGCEGCLVHAIALGDACRVAQLSGVVVYALLRETTGYQPRSPWAQQFVAVSPRDQLMLSAIDAFYGVIA